MRIMSDISIVHNRRMLTELENRYPWLPYVVPMAIFMLITSMEGSAGANYPLLYIAKVVVVIVALLMFKTPLREIKFEAKWLVPSVLVGIVLLVAWVGIEQALVYPHLGERTGYNPFEKIADPTMRTTFIAFRFLGLALMVPVMEEIFWRSFGLRIASQSDFRALPIGSFTWTGFGIVAAVFAGSHPEWIPAAIFAAATGLWIKQTKSLFACIVVHAVTNLGLGIYVVTQNAWKFW
jgi:CAAX prenyl protease-like protein